jgi:hypothetical protein
MRLHLTANSATYLTTSNRQRDSGLANDNWCAMIEIAMSTPIKVEILILPVALHHSL